jgi:hypothetical protein
MDDYKWDYAEYTEQDKALTEVNRYIIKQLDI